MQSEELNCNARVFLALCGLFSSRQLCAYPGGICDHKLSLAVASAPIISHSRIRFL